jgi:hypothetical protein
MIFPRLWFGLDATLGKTIRSLKGNPEHLQTVQSIAVVKRLMARMEGSIPDESRDLDEGKFKDLWIFLGFVLDNTIYNEGSCKTLGSNRKSSFRASEARSGIQDFQTLLDSGFRRNDGVNDFRKRLNGKENFSRYPFLFPIALIRLLMEQMEEAEDKGFFVDFDEDVADALSNKSQLVRAGFYEIRRIPKPVPSTFLQRISTGPRDRLLLLFCGVNQKPPWLRSRSRSRDASVRSPRRK